MECEVMTLTYIVFQYLYILVKQKFILKIIAKIIKWLVY